MHEVGVGARAAAEHDVAVRVELRERDVDLVEQTGDVRHVAGVDDAEDVAARRARAELVEHALERHERRRVDLDQRRAAGVRRHLEAVVVDVQVRAGPVGLV